MRNYRGFIIYKDFRYGCTYYMVSEADSNKSFTRLKDAKAYVDAKLEK